MADVVDLNVYRRVQKLVVAEVGKARAAVEANRNPDGTVNGIAALAQLSGLDQREITWMVRRSMELRTAGWNAEQVKGVLRKEGAAKPWL